MKKSFDIGTDIIIPFDFLEQRPKSFNLNDNLLSGVFIDPELFDFFLLTEELFFLRTEENEKIIITDE